MLNRLRVDHEFDRQTKAILVLICKIRAITLSYTTLFKVIQGVRGRYQSKALMRLPISD